MQARCVMLSTFVFTFVLSVPHAVAIRKTTHEPADVPLQTFRLRHGQASDRPPLAGRRPINLPGGNHRDISLTGTDPIPSLQVSEHTTRKGLANQQSSLLHIADKKHRLVPWPSFSKQDSNGVWTRPFMPKHRAPGIQYPFSSLSAPNNSAAMMNPDIALDADYLANTSNSTPLILALAGGTGASIGGTGSANVDRDLLRRMHYQDKAVMLLVLVVYMVALGFSVNLTYRQACNRSPVTYYADPRFHNLAMEGNDIDVFLSTFNQPPKNISLRVAGFLPVTDEMDGSVQWRGENFLTAFTFSLDLTPWMVRETQTVERTGTSDQTRTLHEGVLPEDRSSLNYILCSDMNDLGYVEIVKRVKWTDWEELATNIKHQIRQSGFQGVISVDHGHSDELQVYKNKAWANFMHARATRVLCALSIFGWLLYVPYMWVRCKSMVVRSYYRVDVGISEYWPLISEQLTANGFEENRRVPIAVNS